MLVKKVLGSLSRAWLLLMRVTTFILLAENSWNEVKHISELQVAFENISKNFTKSASKNLGVWKSNFPSVFLMQIPMSHNCKTFLGLGPHFSKVPAPDDPCPWRGYCYRQDQSYDKQTNIHSFKHCLQFCQVDMNCQTWTYVKDSRTCYLFKTTSVDLYKDIGCISGDFECSVYNDSYLVIKYVYRYKK